MRTRGTKVALLACHDGRVIGAICLKRLVSLSIRGKVEEIERDGNLVVVRLLHECPVPHDPSPTRRNVLLRDRFVCQYTGVKLDRLTASIDHVVPVSRWREAAADPHCLRLLPKETAMAIRHGLGPHCWGNMVASHVDVNNAKDNLMPWEFGLSAEPWVPTWQHLTLAGLRSEWQHYIRFEGKVCRLSRSL